MYIKVLRQKKHLSQEKLAELCELSLRTIQRVESGHRVSYASLRSLAAVFDLNVDKLEQELYSMEKVIETYQDYPLWLRLYLGSGWFTASRQEFKKIEVFFLILGVIFASVWCIGLLIENDIYRIGMFACISCFLGAYNVSISIRVGDKYALWSKLESTLPKGLFGVFRKR